MLPTFLLLPANSSLAYPNTFGALLLLVVRAPGGRPARLLAGAPCSHPAHLLAGALVDVSAEGEKGLMSTRRKENSVLLGGGQRGGVVETGAPHSPGRGHRVPVSVH